MPTTFDVRALESVIRVELDDSVPEADRERMRAEWVDVIEQDAAQPDVTVVGALRELPHSTEMSVRVVSTGSAERLGSLLASEVTLAAIGELSGSALMLHAGAVALDDGRVIALVGPSGRGKTTATQALARELGYVTDETLAFSADGAVVPFRKPLSIGQHPDAKTQVPASEFGLRDLPAAPLELAAMVVLDRREGIDAPYVEHVPLLEALEEIVPQTSYLSSLPRPLRTLVTAILSTGGVRRVVYSEADTLPALIDDVLATTAFESPQLVDIGVSTKDCDCASKLSPFETVETPEADAATLYRRANYRDALTVDDSLVVLSGNRVSVLEGLGPVLWFAAEDATEAELTDAALREMPAPPEHIDPAEVVSATVGELIQAELLTRA
ncbi:ATP-binding protein [Agromyces aurantiacus]|uniref:ATP-binding protein n=1 Tax=Agromyces aurantiacus TaxID=165814 RepID=A0ABV9R1T2_9MICO|nr:ATP-binding protein [Agromyces aurantiacus]MBM7502741.1 energy-coupling factor transporter ATP-binding protein EcfA2 [Agromyces aurantiacus]